MLGGGGGGRTPGRLQELAGAFARAVPVPRTGLYIPYVEKNKKFSKQLSL